MKQTDDTLKKENASIMETFHIYKSKNQCIKRVHVLTDAVKSCSGLCTHRNISQITSEDNTSSTEKTWTANSTYIDHVSVLCYTTRLNLTEQNLFKKKQKQKTPACIYSTVKRNRLQIFVHVNLGMMFTTKNVNKGFNYYTENFIF